MNTPKPGGNDIINLSPDHMVDHPAGAHYVLWNGPDLLDVGVPAGGFVRFALANLTPQWTLLMDAQHQQLPVAVRYDGRTLAIWWLPYDGPAARPAARTGGGLSDTDCAAGSAEALGDPLQRLDGCRVGYRRLVDVSPKIADFRARDVRRIRPKPSPGRPAHSCDGGLCFSAGMKERLSAFGTSRHFVAAQQFGRFRSKADIEPRSSSRIYECTA
jgi:hypothetical protein